MTLCLPKLSSYWPPAADTHLIISFSVQIKKKSIDKAKQEEKQSKAFAAMEEAAMKAYQEDLKRMEREAAGNTLYFNEIVFEERCLLFDGFFFLNDVCVLFFIRFTTHRNSRAKSEATGETSGEATGESSGQTTVKKTAV